jgi:hypothetical protein
MWVSHVSKTREMRNNSGRKIGEKYFEQEEGGLKFNPQTQTPTIYE